MQGRYSQMEEVTSLGHEAARMKNQGRDPDVGIAMSELSGEIDCLTDILQKLGARLSPVSRQEPATNVKESPQRHGNCELSERLFSMQQRLTNLRVLVTEQIGVLEI